MVKVHKMCHRGQKIVTSCKMSENKVKFVLYTDTKMLKITALTFRLLGQFPGNGGQVVVVVVSCRLSGCQVVVVVILANIMHTKSMFLQLYIFV